MTGRWFQATTPPTMMIRPKAIRITPRFQPAAFCPVSARGTPVVVALPPPTPPLGELLGLGDREGEELGDCEGEELGDCEGEG